MQFLSIVNYYRFVGISIITLMKVDVSMLQVRSVKVNNVSLTATVQDIKEFFSFSGDIEHVEMQRFVKLENCISEKIAPICHGKIIL
jgi:hypothetical protein